MKTILIQSILLFGFIYQGISQDFGDFNKIEKDKLHRDLEILHQGLDKFHSGMYWYTPKDSVDFAFKQVKMKVDHDMNVLKFNSLIAPLVALSREGHTGISLSNEEKINIKREATFIPLTFVFLGTKLFCVKNGSQQDLAIEGLEVKSINGVKPKDIGVEIGNQFASDGFIKADKYNRLEGFSFSKYYYYHYGNFDFFNIKFIGLEQNIKFKSQNIDEIEENLEKRYDLSQKMVKRELLEYKILNDSIAYLGVHTFSNSDIKEYSKEKSFKKKLKQSFKSIAENNIKTLIIDVSKNGGGNEGNENLLYSYIGENYQKYIKVRAKTQKAILDNGIDKPTVLKTFGFLERFFLNKKMKDGSLERRQWIGFGLMAYKKKPKNRFSGKVYVIISPDTYSGASEFSNMMYTKGLGTFVGQETGGGYYGNTSGYSNELMLPHSKIEISLPALQFMMNVDAKLPFGSGVIPDYKVIPTYQEYIDRKDVALEYILKMESNR